MFKSAAVPQPPIDTNGVAYRPNSRVSNDNITAAQSPTYLNYRKPILFTSSVQAGASLFRRSVPQAGDVRRDSGLAASMPAHDQPPGETNGLNTPVENGGPIPSITVHDVAGEPSTTNSKTAVGLGDKISHDIVPEGGQDSSSTPAREAFIGIQTDIPNGNLDAQFSSENINISNRGSVYVRRRKENDRDTKEDAQPDNMIGSNMQKAVPSGEYLESVNGRVFSADDRRLSKRVRSMYELGMEFSKGHTDRPNSVLSGQTEETQDQDTLGDLPQSSLSPRFSIRLVGGDGSRSVSALSNRSSIQREPGEAAGGVEDWTDVDFHDVDRYGFIRPRSAASKRSSVTSSSVPGSPDPNRVQRPLASLAVIDETHQTQAETWPKPQAQPKPTINSSTRPKPLPTLRKRRSTAFDTFRSSRSRHRRLIADASTMLDPLPRNDPSSPPLIDDSKDHARTKLERSRAVKWEKMAKPIRHHSTPNGVVGAGTTFTFDTSDPKVITRTWKGIPDRWRATAWHSFLTTSASRRSPTGRPEPSDATLIARFHALQDLDCPDDVQIDLDVPRTIGRHIMFRKRYRGGQRLLFRVLRALALHFPQLGYVQGMAPLAATLLCYFDEEHAFVIAARMWELRGVGWLYADGFGGLMGALEEFETVWMPRADPEVRARLEALGVGPTAFGTKWYLTLFNYSLPFEAQLRVWDVFLLLGDPSPKTIRPVVQASGGATDKDKAVDGLAAAGKPNLDVLHAVAAALLLGLRAELRAAEFETVMGALTRGVPVRERGGEDVLMRVARAILNMGKAVR